MDKFNNFTVEETNLFPACTRFLRLVLRIALSLAAFAGDDNRKPIIPAQLVAHVPYAVIRPLVGNILVMIYEVDRTKYDVVMDMSLVNVRRQYILMLPFGYSVGKLPPDLMGFLIVHFPRSKGLYHVKG